VGCGPTANTVSTSSPSTDPAVTANQQGDQITIADAAGLTIPGAKVMIGARENVPFPGNVVVADSNGRIALPKQWTDAQPITVDAAGYVRATYFNVKPGALKLVLHKNLAGTRNELRGETNGYANLEKDGTLDVAVALPALSRSQLSLLEPSTVISPELDEMTVAGQSVNVPSNVSIPFQRESYIITVKVSKPVYRLYLNEARKWKIVAAHVRFPFRSVASDLRDGKSFLDLVNKFEFSGASVKTVDVNSGSSNADLPVNEIDFAPALPLTSPSFGSEYSMLGVAMVENDGLYYPSDVKRFAAKESRTLAAPKSAYKGLIVSVLRRNDVPDFGPASAAYSAVVSPSNMTQGLDFLAIPKAPELRSGTLVLNPPATLKGVAPAMTYALLSKVETVQAGDRTLENKSPQWELYAEDWASNLTLPELPRAFDDVSESAAKGKSRWEVLFGGQGAGASPVDVGPAALEKVSHVTRSAVDF
jgi:hypothetical protein